jgi:hypothetical protein
MKLLKAKVMPRNSVLIKRKVCCKAEPDCLRGNTGLTERTVSLLALHQFPPEAVNKYYCYSSGECSKGIA